MYILAFKKAFGKSMSKNAQNQVKNKGQEALSNIDGQNAVERLESCNHFRNSENESQEFEFATSKLLVKFMFSKKSTKTYEIFTVDLEFINTQ